MGELSRMQIRDLFDGIKDFDYFSNVEAYLREKGLFRSNSYSFESISTVPPSRLIGMVLQSPNVGILLGFERQGNSPILGEFAYQLKEPGQHHMHLRPVFLERPAIPLHFSYMLSQIMSGNFNFTYLDEGEYLVEEARIALKHVEELPLEEELSLLGLFDQISTELAEINEERFRKNQPTTPFDDAYNRFMELVRRIPQEKRTPRLEARLQM